MRATYLAIRKFKRLLEFLAYGLFDGAVLACARLRISDEQRIAVVHMELLGDYFIWLPYGLALQHHLRTQGKRMVLVCGAAWAELAQHHFDGSEIVAIERRRFFRDWRYRAQALRNLRALRIGLTYHMSYPRECIVGDAIVRAIGARAWGVDAVLIDRPWLDRIWSRCWYARLLPPIAGVHQSIRHRAFLQAAGVEPNDSFRLRVTPPAHSNSIPEPYFLIAPGGSHAGRRWPAERFAEICQRITDHAPEWQCIVIGTADERALGERIVQRLGGRAINLAGETPVSEMVSLIAHARLALCNDSAAGHIAAVYGTASVAVVGGGHFGRCYPYEARDKVIPMLPATVSHPMDCFGCDWVCRYPTRPGEPFPCVENIDVAAVWAAVKPVLVSNINNSTPVVPPASTH